MLDEVHFAGIKSLKDVRIPLAPFTVIVGPNGCGKTTILEQTEIINNSLRELSLQFSLSNPTSEIRKPQTLMRGAHKHERSIKIKHISVSVLNPAFSFNNSAEIIISSGQIREKISIDDKPSSISKIQSILASATIEKSRRINPIHEAISKPSPLLDQNYDIGMDGSGLPSLLAHIAINHHVSYLSIQEDLKRIVPHFEELHLSQIKITPGANAQNGFGIELSLKGAGRIPAKQASEGTLLALALLTVVHGPDMPRILLIDDIDRGLHLGAQVRMSEAIRAVMKVRPDLQVICTTHSPFMLQSFPAEDIRVLALDKEGHTRVKTLTEHPQYEKWSNVMSAGEIWANLGEEWVTDGQ